MPKSLKINSKLALFLMAALAVSAWAEVKLRIYLQDGTLQAGNLVAETAETFVILTKEGRSEIAKEKIMFINGKTLKQWEERPDKLFQTEIIPSDIPNPAYVNDKAAMPAVPALTKSKPAIQPVTKPINDPNVVQPAPAKSAEPVKPVPKPDPSPSPVSEPKAESETATVQAAPSKPESRSASAPVTSKKEPVHASPPASVAAVVGMPNPAKLKKIRKLARSSKLSEPKPIVKVDKATTREFSTPSEASAVPRPAKFVRKDYGDYHYQRALAFLKSGERGRALQELHIATVLDRQNPESVLLIGRLYKDEGETLRAEKYFSHPLIKKQEEVKKFSEEMNTAAKKQKHTRWILYAGASVGALAWVPLLIGWRKLRRTPSRIITAESFERNVEEKSAEKESIEDPQEETIPVEPAFMKIPPVAPAILPKSAIEQAPLELPVMEQQQTFQPVVEEAPNVTPPVGNPRFEIDTAEILRRIHEPPKTPPPIPEPDPVPVKSEESVLSYSAKLDLDTEAVLRLAAMVDKALRQGNAYAGDEKHDLARREYRTALALNPECAEAYLGLGYLCFVQGQWELALEHYLKSLEIAPNSADAHYGIGRVLLETDRINEAVPEFQTTLELDPTFSDARDTLSALGAAA